MPPKKSPSKATTASGKPPVASAATRQTPGSQTGATGSKAGSKPGGAAGKTTRGGGMTAQRGRGGTSARGGAIANRGRGRGSTVGGKQAGQAKGKGGNDSLKPQKPAWTKEDGAARKIQTVFRRYRAKKTLSVRRKEKEDYDLLMDKIQREVSCKTLIYKMCSYVCSEIVMVWKLMPQSHAFYEE